MRKEIQLDFGQTKELSYMSTLFDMLDRSKKKLENIKDLTKKIKSDREEIKKELLNTYRKLISSGLSSYQIYKNIADKHRYKVIYMLRSIAKGETTPKADTD